MPDERDVATSNDSPVRLLVVGTWIGPVIVAAQGVFVSKAWSDDFCPDEHKAICAFVDDQRRLGITDHDPQNGLWVWEGNAHAIDELGYFEVLEFLEGQWRQPTALEVLAFLRGQTPWTDTPVLEEVKQNRDQQLLLDLRKLQSDMKGLQELSQQDGVPSGVSLRLTSGFIDRAVRTLDETIRSLQFNKPCRVRVQKIDRPEVKVGQKWQDMTPRLMRMREGGSLQPIMRILEVVGIVPETETTYGMATCRVLPAGWRVKSVVQVRLSRMYPHKHGYRLIFDPSQQQARAGQP